MRRSLRHAQLSTLNVGKRPVNRLGSRRTLVEFRILGSLEVVRQGEVLPPPANKPRALLALLLLHRGESVSLERLADDLWGEQPPATATKSIHVYVSQLRRMLGDGVLETRGRGYALLVEPAQIDAGRFERLLEEGSVHLAAGRHQQAADVLAEALGLWRGPVLGDFAYESWAQAEISRLDDLRLAAYEERIEADLALGRHATLISELEGLVERNPTRERLLGQLMLALYRTGRQTDALSVYRERRRKLLDELGIELSPLVRDLEAAILRQDPDLRAPERPVAALLKTRRRVAVPLAAAAVLLVGAATAFVALTGETATPAPRAIEPLPASMCSPIAFQPGTHPRHLIVSDQELGGSNAVLGNQIAAAVEFVLRDNGFMAGKRAVAYQSCDSKGPGCANAGRTYANNADVIAVIGPLISTCAEQMIPVTNRIRPGPLAVLSPSNTKIGLTRATGAVPDEPERFYPTDVRNYVRLVAADDFQFAALAMLAQQLDARRIFVLVGAEEFAESRSAFRSAADKLALPIVGEASWLGRTGHLERAEQIRAERADAVVLVGALADDGVSVVRALRAVLPSDVHLLAGDGFSDPGQLAELGRDSEGLYVSVPGIDPAGLTGPGRRLIDRLSASIGDPHPYTVSAAQATQLLLDTVARSDGTRRSVVSELFASEVRDGILGDFSVTTTGDTTANSVTIYRIENGERQVDRVLTPPLNLVVPQNPF
jgi:DNA-binding SARP family transcriptional activator